MPCIEMKELELLCARFAERRSRQQPLSDERRKGSGLVRQSGQARAAYLIQAHQLACKRCSS